jgi:putative acetyltransferase
VQIVEAGAADTATVLRIERAAFGRDDEAALVAALLSDPTAQPCLSLLACVAGEPVGHALYTRAGVAGAGGVRAAILAPLAVLPGAQRQGVGRALIERGAALLAAAGVPLLFVLGDPAYYTRSGFLAASPCGLAPPLPVVPAAAWMLRPLAPGMPGAVRGSVTCAQAMARPELWRE